MLGRSYLVEVDDWLPELVLQLVEVAHTDFTEVTRMVLVHVGAVVVLTTGKTTTTGMLPGLANTTVTGRNVAATMSEDVSSMCEDVRPGLYRICGDGRARWSVERDAWGTYCLRVLVSLVGILSDFGGFEQNEFVKGWRGRILVWNVGSEVLAALAFDYDIT